MARCRATTWNRIRKFRSGVHDGEARSVLGLVLEAWEERAEVVAFTRDTDGEDGRRGRIERAVAAAEATFAGEAFRDQPIAIIGGPACPAIEGGLLALAGERNTDAMSKAKAASRLAERAVALKKGPEYVAVVEAADLAKPLPAGCDSLEDWLDRARAVLPVAVHGVAKNNV